LHSAWEGDFDAVYRAGAAIDVLLDRRNELMQAAAAGTGEAVAA
jgi:hypothetical protein